MIIVHPAYFFNEGILEVCAKIYSKNAWGTFGAWKFLNLKMP